MKKYLISIDPVHIIIVVLTMIVHVKFIITGSAKRSTTRKGIIQNNAYPYRLGGEAHVYIPETLQAIKK